MIGAGRIAHDVWHQRFEAARTDLLDARNVLDVHARLATQSRTIVFGDAVALKRASSVGVFSGSFNPQTLAHVEVAEAARAGQRLDVVMWALARTTVDKENVDRASLADRVVQLRAYIRAAASRDVAVIIGAGLYADQAEEIRSLVGSAADVWLIAGFDKVVQIFDPRYYTDRDATLRRLFDAAGLLVAPRASHGAADLAAKLADPANQAYASRINMLPTSPEVASIASTDARGLMRGDVAPERLRKLLTPEGVALGIVTGAYRDIERMSDGTVHDIYASRIRWLASMDHVS